MNSPDAEIYGLSLDDIERFDITYAGSDDLITESAIHWCEELSPYFHSVEACRWEFLQRMTNPTGQASPVKEMREFPTVARYLCWRAERRVRELDGP